MHLTNTTPNSLRFLRNPRALPTLNNRLLSLAVSRRPKGVHRTDRQSRAPAVVLKVERAGEAIDGVGLPEALDEGGEVLALARGAAADEVGCVAGAADAGDAEEVEHFDVALLSLAGVELGGDGVGGAQEDGEDEGEEMHGGCW